MVFSIPSLAFPLLLYPSPFPSLLFIFYIFYVINQSFIIIIIIIT